MIPQWSKYSINEWYKNNRSYGGLYGQRMLYKKDYVNKYERQRFQQLIWEKIEYKLNIVSNSPRAQDKKSIEFTVPIEISKSENNTPRKENDPLRKQSRILENFPKEMFSSDIHPFTHHGRQISLALRSTEILVMGVIKGKMQLITWLFLNGEYISCQWKSSKST